jgi:hypothetical protein
MQHVPVICVSNLHHLLPQPVTRNSDCCEVSMFDVRYVALLMPLPGPFCRQHQKFPLLTKASRLTDPCQTGFELPASCCYTWSTATATAYAGHAAAVPCTAAVAVHGV